MLPSLRKLRCHIGVRSNAASQFDLTSLPSELRAIVLSVLSDGDAASRCKAVVQACAARPVCSGVDFGELARQMQLDGFDQVDDVDTFTAACRAATMAADHLWRRREARDLLNTLLDIQHRKVQSLTLAELALLLQRESLEFSVAKAQEFVLKKIIAKFDSKATLSTIIPQNFIFVVILQRASQLLSVDETDHDHNGLSDDQLPENDGNVLSLAESLQFVVNNIIEYDRGFENDSNDEELPESMTLAFNGNVMSNSQTVAHVVSHLTHVIEEVRTAF